MAGLVLPVRRKPLSLRRFRLAAAKPAPIRSMIAHCFPTLCARPLAARCSSKSTFGCSLAPLNHAGPASSKRVGTTYDAQLS
eukprot:2111931-Pyramimonas_sp.AAC.1